MSRRFYYIPEDEPWFRKASNFIRTSAVPVKAFPEDIQIQTVSGCNARCIFCPNGTGSSKLPSGRMDWSLFKKIIDECFQNRVKRISPYLMGEPLLDRDIVKKIRYIAENRQNGLSIKLNTNAGLLNDEMRRPLAGSGLDRLNISCHGISQQAYEASMKGLCLATTLKNIDNFLGLLKKGNNKKPRVAITMVKTKLIEKEIPLIKKYWHQREISVHIQKLENRSNTEIAGKGIEPGSWQHFSHCKRLFTQAYILFNGDMLLCCADYGYTTVLGNVSEQNIKEIWNSAKALDIRRRFLSGNTQGLLCHSCFKQPG